MCLTPSEFWPSVDSYTMCEAPTLSAQAACYIATALAVVVTRWRAVLVQLEFLVNSGNVLRRPDHLQDILFDDDAFSTSKRYFWAINFIHEVVDILDNSIQQWTHHKKHWITPRLTTAGSGQEAHWQRKSREVLAAAEQRADEACDELRALKQEFEDTLRRVTVMRDGVSLPVF